MSESLLSGKLLHSLLASLLSLTLSRLDYQLLFQEMNLHSFSEKTARLVNETLLISGGMQT